MQQRQMIPKGTVLHLVPDGFDPKREKGYISERAWVVGDVVGMGGSVVCYKAICGRKNGKLKQFTPENRNFGALLSEGESMESIFSIEAESFLHPYRIIDTVRMEKPESQAINNYISPFEILYGTEEKAETGVYIWLPDDRSGATLKEYIKNIRSGNCGKGENSRSEGNIESEVSRLYKLLDIILKLTEAVMAFHSAGVFNLDIKPSNILVSFGWEEDPDSSQITLLDFDTVTVMGEEKGTFKVTDGYSAPELYAGHGDYRSDIYSIGACMYTAIMSAGDHLETYSKTHYESEKSDILPDGSRRFKQMRHLDGGCLIRIVNRIMRRCLEEYPNNRYDSCEELASDIKKAKYSMLNELIKDF